MVHHPGPGTDALSRALAAERLPQELRRTKILCPYGHAVPAVPVGGGAARRFWGLMSRTVSLPRQFWASRVSTGPGRLQGHGLSPPGKTKSAQAINTQSGSLMAQALVTVDAGSGASIFTSVSCPQRLHILGRLWAVVSDRIFSSFPFRHTGHIIHPSFMISLPHCAVLRKPFQPLFLTNKREYTNPQDRKE